MTAAVETGKGGHLPEKVSALHPAFSGHFPGDPLLPGVVLLDRLIQQIQEHYAVSVETNRCFKHFHIESVKFLNSVRPNDEISFQWEEQGTRLKFHIYSQALLVARGVLIPLPSESVT